jgi:hypothetical protein
MSTSTPQPTKEQKQHNAQNTPILIPRPHSHNNLNLTPQTPVARILQLGPQ